MSKFKIEITENGVSILTKDVQTLYDADGNPVEVDNGNKRIAMGVEDFNTITEFRAGLDGLCSKVFGKTLSKAIADIKISKDQLDAANKRASDAEARIAALEKQLNAANTI